MTLKIQKSSGGRAVVFVLSGRIEAKHVTELQAFIDLEDQTDNIVLDLGEVKLVDRESVVFLARCEENGTKLENCPGNVCECI